MHTSAYERAIEAIDGAVVPGRGITTVRLSKELFPMSDEDLTAIGRYYAAMGYTASLQVRGSTYDVAVELFEVG